MSTEQNKQLVLRFMNEFLGEHRFEVLDELLGPTYTQHNPAINDSKEASLRSSGNSGRNTLRPSMT